MKKFTTLLLIICLALIPFRAANAEPPPQHLIGKCLFAAIVLGVGYVIIRGLIRLCECLPNPNSTNINTNCPPYNTNRHQAKLEAGIGARLNSPIRIESAPKVMGSMFVEQYTFTFIQTDLGVQCVASRGGVPVLTNYPAMLEDRGIDYYAEYDFTSLTNSGNFFRLVSLEH